MGGEQLPVNTDDFEEPVMPSGGDASAAAGDAAQQPVDVSGGEQQMFPGGDYGMCVSPRS